MSDKNRKKIAINASRDFVFSVLALIIYNGVLQLFIYPGLNDRMGEEAFGTVLYLISIISVMGAGFGTAASYSRMVAKKDRTQANGDYNLFLLTVSAISIGVTAVSLLIIKELKAGVFFPVLILMIVTVFRYYADVEYRMNIRFADYFFFFLMTSIGYCLGLFIYPHTGNWIYTLLIGEVFGIIYTVIRGKIFRPPFFQLSGSYRENYSSAFIISASNLISALILNSDRIFLRLLVGASEVTVFYTASLIGKIVAMLTTPLNGIIISYFTNYRLKITRKVFAAIGGGLIVISALLAVFCSSVSYVFVKFKYPEVLEEARQYFFLANLGQILFFLSGSLMVVVLSFTKEKLQLFINIVYVISFAAVVIPLCLMFGVVGMAYGLVIVNLIRLIVTVIFGLRAL